ncbi:MAG TPA: hypothetical protein VM099_06095 [Gemmatimonadaceae bacterium]|nr:hypothetical protein [Gemmatimonadaceae bacterium]
MDVAAQRAPEREPFSVSGILIAAIVGLAIVYVIQAATPLRLDDDALDYLNIAAALTDGRPAPNLPIPHGYSWIVSLLERIRLGSSAFIVLANCFFLAIGLASLWKMRVYSRQARLIAVFATLLAIPVIKAAPMALPDAAFLGVFLLALFFMTIESPPTPTAIVCATILMVIAVNLRYAGIALVAPLGWVLISRRTTVADTTGGRRLLRIVIVAAVVAVIVVWMLMSSRLFFLYLAQARDYYGTASLPNRIWNRGIVLLQSTGEIVLNLPYSRFRSLRWIYVIFGLATVGLAVKTVRPPLRMNAQRVCLLSYLLLIAVWPSPAPRLFIPLIPLVAAEAVEAFVRTPRARWARLTAGSYAVWFFLTGAAALAYTTRISLSGSNFTHVYGKNGGMPDPDIHEGDPSWPHVQYYRQVAPMLLQRYGDSRARGQ